jgi:dihydrofolate reductase/thymidylate synthase
MAFFRDVTTNCAEGKINAVIMGRKTYESIPPKFRPLPDRLNIILSKSVEFDGKNLVSCKSLEDALAMVKQNDSVDRVFIAGGGEIYKEAIKLPECSKIYFTKIKSEFDCDTFFPEIDEKVFFKSEGGSKEEKKIQFQFLEYQRI